MSIPTFSELVLAKKGGSSDRFSFYDKRDLSVGDIVKCPSNHEALVINVSSSICDVFHAVYDDGSTCNYSSGSYLPVCDSKSYDRSWKYTVVSLPRVLSLLSLGESVNVPLLHAPLSLGPPIDINSVNPYLLGLLLGSGSLTRPLSFSTSDQTLAYYITSYGFKESPSTLFSTLKNYVLEGDTVESETPYPISTYLTLGNVPDVDKYIPVSYMYSSINSRLELLQGILDSSSSIADDGSFISLFLQGTTLALDLQRLSRSFGLISSLSELKGVDKGKYLFTIQVRMNDFQIFRLAKNRWCTSPECNEFVTAGCRTKRLVSLSPLLSPDGNYNYPVSTLKLDHPLGYYLSTDFTIALA